MTTPHNGSGNGFLTTQDYPAARESEIVAEQDVIEQILDRFFPRWRQEVETRKTYRWHRHYVAAQRCLAQIKRQQEVDEWLGVSGPSLSSSQLPAWVWEAAKAQWASGHFIEAVSAAAKSVNSHLQQKLNRRDISEVKLVQEAFAMKPTSGDRNRLRLMDDDGSATFTSLHEGVLPLVLGASKPYVTHWLTFRTTTSNSPSKKHWNGLPL